MSRNVSNVNISTDSFLTWITQTNKLLQALRTDVVTVSTTITGGNTTLANTTGNAQILGTLGVNTVVATNALRGGNASATNILNIVSNTSLVGSTTEYFFKVGANVQANATTLAVGDSTTNIIANSSTITIGSNVTVNTSLLFIGNATVNSIINNAFLVTNTGNFRVGANVGANVNLTTSSLQIGNATANLNANSILLRIANATFSSNITPLDLTIGPAIVNSSIITIGLGNFSLGVNVGANVNLTTSTIQVVNSISNVVVNSGLIRAANTTAAGANLTPADLKIGTTLVNASLVSVTGVNTSYANVTGQVNTATLYATSYINVGTSFTANATLVNAIALNVVNQTNTATLYATTSANVGTAFTANATLVNAIALNVVNQTNTATLFATTSANVGGNVQVTTSQYGITGTTTIPTMALNTSSLTIGNSTITGAPTINLANSTGNTIIYANAIDTTWGFDANNTGVYVTNFVNAASHTVGSSFIANATALVHTGYANVTTSVNSALLTVGTNFIANATALVHTGYANVTGAVNASSHTVGTNFIANATALVHTGYANITGVVNASSHTVGTTFTANATLVNAAAINVTGQVNTATFYVATSANVGSNVQVTTSQLFIGNATVNSFANSVMLKVSNSTAYTSIEPGSVSLTGASITTGVASFTGLTINTNYEIQVLANTDLGINTTSALVIYTFPTTYSSAKILAQVRRTGNTQTSDMIVAHDGTDAFISVYGTVISPSTSADLGDFSVGINGSNVELKYKQTGTNSAVKLAAHLIKT